MRLFPNRLYRHGMQWALWRWTEVRSLYITRFHLLKTPWFAICVHWIHKPDEDAFLHDHPVSFLSIILRGGYDEERLDRLAKHRWYNLIHWYTLHKIVKVLPHTTTLTFMGPKRQEWGFYTPAGKVYWKEYYKEREIEKFDAHQEACVENCGIWHVHHRREILVDETTE